VALPFCDGFVTGKTSISILFYRDVTDVTAPKGGRYIHTSKRRHFSRLSRRVQERNYFRQVLECGSPMPLSLKS